MRKDTKRISAEVFIRAYMNCRDLRLLAAQLGTTYNYLTQKAYSLRKRGVRLPKMVRTDEEHVNKLNEIIDTYEKKDCSIDLTCEVDLRSDVNL